MSAFVQKIAADLVVVHVPCDITDEEIDSAIRLYLPNVFEAQQGWVCAIAGYDTDDRELYDIPEAKALCKRLVERGFISCLHVSTLMTKDEKPEYDRFLGALEIWAISTGHMNSKDGLLVEHPDSQIFLDALDKANKTAVSLLPFASDGMHRTSING